MARPRLADDLAPVILAPSRPRGFADDLAFGIVIVFTTYLSLVLGELVPKRIAMSAPGKHRRDHGAVHGAARDDLCAAGVGC